jgi:hypothetical protein
VSKGRQKIRFEGLLQENVLGTFSVIRGFADLRDLAAVGQLGMGSHLCIMTFFKIFEYFRNSGL